jgi:hypothetical protein
MSNKSVSDFVAATMDAVLKSEAHKALFGTQYKYASDENDAKGGKCSKCDCPKDDCKCGDMGMADGPATGTGQGADPYVFKPDTIKAKPPEAPKPGDKAKADDSFAWDDNDARKKKKDEDEEDKDDKKDDEDDASFAWDDNDARKSKKKDDDEEDEKDDKKDEDKADDLSAAAAFDVAIDSLLSASAALDSVGMEKSAALSLRLATLVVEAKKKDKDDKNAAKDKAKKEKEKAAKEKEKLKAQKEKDKAKADAQAAKDKASKDKAKEKEKAEKEKAKEKAAKEKAKK